MTLIDLVTADAIQEFMGAPRYVSGGSVANTTAGIAELGGRAGFVGALADDEVGRTYTENLRAAGVEFEPHVSESAAGDGLGTGRCIVLITEDAERTMGTYLGAASTLTPEGVPIALRGARLGRPARGLPVGRAHRQGGHAPRRGHRPRVRRLGRPLAVGSRSASRRHQREFLDLLIDDVDILLGQRGGDHHALRSLLVPGRH